MGEKGCVAAVAAAEIEAAVTLLPRGVLPMDEDGVAGVVRGAVWGDEAPAGEPSCVGGCPGWLVERLRGDGVRTDFFSFLRGDVRKWVATGLRCSVAVPPCTLGIPHGTQPRGLPDEQVAAGNSATKAHPKINPASFPLPGSKKATCT